MPVKKLWYIVDIYNNEFDGPYPSEAKAKEQAELFFNAGSEIVTCKAVSTNRRVDKVQWTKL